MINKRSSSVGIDSAAIAQFPFLADRKDVVRSIVLSRIASPPARVRSLVQLTPSTNCMPGRWAVVFWSNSKETLSCWAVVQRAGLHRKEHSDLVQAMLLQCKVTIHSMPDDHQ